jgi:FKBP-type peptidyl-prolyl cis-trans isomerase FkpA
LKTNQTKTSNTQNVKNMQYTFSFLLLCCIGSVAMAQNPVMDSAPAVKKEASVVNHTQKTGAKPTYGQTITLHVNTFLGDSLFMSTRRDYKKAQEITLPTQEQYAAEPDMPAILKTVLGMSVGDSVTILEPIADELREGLPEGFKNAANIRYQVVLSSIVTAEDLAKRAAEAQVKAEATKARSASVAQQVQTALTDYKAGKLGNRLQKSASGLEYIIIEKGTGAPIKMGDHIDTHYYGALKSTGAMFDNSFDRGESIDFPVGNLVPGFNEGMLLLNRGGKAIIFIPSALGYGEQGAGEVIPPNSDLVFYMELN